MATFVSKFNIGDKVWHGSVHVNQFKHDCPDCLGTQKWEAKSPAGLVCTFACPRCSTSYQSHDSMCLTYSKAQPYATEYTVSEVQFEGTGFRYFCQETSQGPAGHKSGSFYHEKDFFPTEKEALVAAQAQADKTNADPTTWIKKQYDQRLVLSDYQLDIVGKKEFENVKWNWFYDLRQLLDTLKDDKPKEARASINKFLKEKK